MGARRRPGRSGSGGAAVARELGQLDPRRRTDSNLSNCDLGVHRSGEVAARTHFRGGLPYETVLYWRVSPAMVVNRRGARPARHEPDEPATYRDTLLRRRLEPG